MNSDILKRMRDALSLALSIGDRPILAKRREQWEALVKEYDDHDWFVTSTIADREDPADGSMGDDSA